MVSKLWKDYVLLEGKVLLTFTDSKSLGIYSLVIKLPMKHNHHEQRTDKQRKIFSLYLKEEFYVNKIKIFNSDEFFCPFTTMFIMNLYRFL